MVSSQVETDDPIFRNSTVSTNSRSQGLIPIVTSIGGTVNQLITYLFARKGTSNALILWPHKVHLSVGNLLSTSLNCSSISTSSPTMLVICNLASTPPWWSHHSVRVSPCTSFSYHMDMQTIRENSANNEHLLKYRSKSDRSSGLSELYLFFRTAIMSSGISSSEE